jgi:hypothetical protein
MRRPPPPQAPQLSALAPETSIQTVQSRHKSRFDPLNDNYRPSRDGERDDFPASVSRRRDQPAHTNVERNRADNDDLLSDDFVPNDSAGRRSSLNDRHRPPASHSDRPISPAAAMPLEQSRTYYCSLRPRNLSNQRRAASLLDFVQTLDRGFSWWSREPQMAKNDDRLAHPRP